MGAYDSGRLCDLSFLSSISSPGRSFSISRKNIFVFSVALLFALFSSGFADPLDLEGDGLFILEIKFVNEEDLFLMMPVFVNSAISSSSFVTGWSSSK